MLPLNPEKPDEDTKGAVEIYENAHKRTAARSVENVVTNKSMRPSNDFNLTYRLSMRLDDGRGPSLVSSRLNDGLPKKNSFPSLKDSLKILRYRALKIDTEDPQYITFLKYEIRKDCNEWSLPRCFGEVRLFNREIELFYCNPGHSKFFSDSESP